MIIKLTAVTARDSPRRLRNKLIRFLDQQRTLPISLVPMQPYGNMIESFLMYLQSEYPELGLYDVLQTL